MALYARFGLARRCSLCVLPYACASPAVASFGLLQTLSTFAGDFRALKALIAAEYNGVTIVSTRGLKIALSSLRPQAAGAGVHADAPPLCAPHLNCRFSPSLHLRRCCPQNNATVALGKDNVKPEFLAKNPTGKLPFLETAQGVLFESSAIARYVARIRRDTELLGRSFFEAGQVRTI